MNPRYRRLLIPGLLVALVVVAAVSALIQKASAESAGPGVVSVIDDSRITEASGLAISQKHPDLVYVVNDSGHAAVVYAVELSTGKVVGTTTLQGVNVSDTEALSMGPDGKLWVADTGDNLRRRDDAALYAFDEPGPGNHQVRPDRFGIGFGKDGVAHDIEALLIDPRDGRVYLMTKGLLSGEILRLPEHLDPVWSNTAEVVGDEAPGMVTDATFTRSGRYALVRTYGDVRLFSTTTWKQMGRIKVPSQQQGESIAAENGSFLIGTEGRPSPMIRVARPDVVTPSEMSAAVFGVAAMLAFRRP